MLKNVHKISRWRTKSFTRTKQVTSQMKYVSQNVFFFREFFPLCWSSRLQWISDGISIDIAIIVYDDALIDSNCWSNLSFFNKKKTFFFGFSDINDFVLKNLKFKNRSVTKLSLTRLTSDCCSMTKRGQFCFGFHFGSARAVPIVNT